MSETTAELPEIMREMDLDAVDVRSLELFYERHGNRLFRFTYRGRRMVLKCLGPANVRESESYCLLRGLGVPTLSLHARTSTALLLDDLAANETWRLAQPADLSRPEVGESIGLWYRALHCAGTQIRSAGGEWPTYLCRETDALRRDELEAAERKLDLAAMATWRLVRDKIRVIGDAMSELSQTLTYNDFYWGNLALSRSASLTEAVLFDFHLLGAGLRYGDYRNVVGSLHPDAVPAFSEAFGPTDEREEALDRAASPIIALVEASKRKRFPKWAESSLAGLKEGSLEGALLHAVEIAEAIV